MSQSAAKETFVPFEPASAPGSGNSTPASGLKVMPKSEAGAAFTPLAASALAHGSGGSAAHGKPVVTLQREGDRVTGIRIECTCGQVIELACSY